MLTHVDEQGVTCALSGALTLLENNGIERACIACNTLHAFLPERKWNLELIDLRHSVPDDDMLILCTSTARSRSVYAHLTHAHYLPLEQQKVLDRLIDDILAGYVSPKESSVLASLMTSPKALLGCTELSLLHTRHPTSNTTTIIDPLDHLATTLLY